VAYSKDKRQKARAMRTKNYGKKYKENKKEIPVGARFFAPGSPSRGIKRPGRDVNHPPSYSTEVRERVELYVYSPSGPPWSCCRVTFTFMGYQSVFDTYRV
jgi:hypothetical protein